jgi:hypothetical protein
MNALIWNVNIVLSEDTSQIDREDEMVHSGRRSIVAVISTKLRN